MALQRFSTDELLLTHMEGWEVLVWFFGGNAGTVPGWLTDDDRSFAQALLIEAIDKSADVGFIRRIWESTVTPPATLKSLASKMVKTGLKILRDRLRHVSVKDFKKAKIYEMIKNQLTRNFRSVWKIRIATGDLIY